MLGAAFRKLRVHRFPLPPFTRCCQRRNGCARAASVDRPILQLGAVPKIKIGENLGPQSNKDVPDKQAPLDPNSPGASAPGNRSAGNTNSLTLGSNDLVPGNLSPDVPNTVPTTGFPGPGIDGLTQQLLSALPSPVQAVSAPATAQLEHIVRMSAKP